MRCSWLCSSSHQHFMLTEAWSFPTSPCREKASTPQQRAPRVHNGLPAPSEETSLLPTGDSRAPGSAGVHQYLLPCPGGLPSGGEASTVAEDCSCAATLSQALPLCSQEPRLQPLSLRNGAPVSRHQGDWMGLPICRGEMPGGEGSRVPSPGQTTHCPVVALSVE